MSNTTRYAVIAHTADAARVADVIVKKSVAIDAATALRNDESVSVTVVSVATGKVVFEIMAPRKIRMSAPYTREVPVAQDEINGKRVAYTRVRVGFALLDANKTGEGNGTYTIYDLVNRRELDDETVEVRTTREAGRWFADEAPALRARLSSLVEA